MGSSSKQNVEVYKIDTAGSKHVRGGEQSDNRKEFAEVLANAHPDVVRAVWREDLQRWHHDVNYGHFTQKLIKKEGLNIPKGPYEWGLKKIRIDNGETKNVEAY